MLNSLFPTLSQQPNRKNKKFQNFHEPRSTSQSPNPNTGNQKHKHKNKTIINNYTFCLTMGLLWSRRLSINPETSLTILTCDDLRSSQISSSLYTGVTLSSSEVAPSIILDLQYDSTALLLESISSTNPKFSQKHAELKKTNPIQFKNSNLRIKALKPSL